MILIGTVIALHSHYEHLDLDFVSKETRRLTYLSEDTIFRKIENNKKALQILIDRHDQIMNNFGETAGAAQWKEDFESEYCDDFDRALIAAKVCTELHDNSGDKCSVGVDWGHKYETRDASLVKEFLAEVDEKIEEKLMYV